MAKQLLYAEITDNNASPAVRGDDLGGEVALQFVFVGDFLGKSETRHRFASPLRDSPSGVTTKAWRSGSKRELGHCRTYCPALCNTPSLWHRSKTRAIGLVGKWRPVSCGSSQTSSRSRCPVNNISVVLYTFLAKSDETCDRAVGTYAVSSDRLCHCKRGG